MQKTMLTYRTLDRFEKEYCVDLFDEAQIKEIERVAYAVNMGRGNDTDEYIYSRFIDCLKRNMYFNGGVRK